MSKLISYKRHRFPLEIIAHAVWLYLRFPLSLRLVEEMLLERGIRFCRELSIRTESRLPHPQTSRSQDAELLGEG